MRRIIASAFVTLDGVMQAPGGPEEDRTGRFQFGGWMFGFGESGLDISDSGFDAQGRELLLGRKTYEIFEAYWPFQGPDNPIARTFNSTKKYVVSRSLKNPRWNNSVVLQGELDSAIGKIKSTVGPDLQVIGSGDLIQSLQAANLIDEYNLWIFPILLGKGKRLFSEGIRPSSMRVVRSQISTRGVVAMTLVPDGEVKTSSFGPDLPSEREIERRKRIREERW